MVYELDHMIASMMPVLERSECVVETLPLGVAPVDVLYIAARKSVFNFRTCQARRRIAENVKRSVRFAVGEKVDIPSWTLCYTLRHILTF